MNKKEVSVKFKRDGEEVVVIAEGLNYRDGENYGWSLGPAGAYGGYRRSFMELFGFLFEVEDKYYLVWFSSDDKPETEEDAISLFTKKIKVDKEKVKFLTKGFHDYWEE